MELSIAEMNYLAAINRLTDDGERVSTSSLANEFGIAAASVTDMVQKLAEKEYVRYEKYKGVSLLPIGKQVAEQSAAQDELWLQFMDEVFNLSKQEQQQVIAEFRSIQSPLIREQLKQFLSAEKQSLHRNQEQQFSREPSRQASLFSQNKQDVHRKEQSSSTSFSLAQAKLGQRYVLLGSKDAENQLHQLILHFQFIIGAEIIVEQQFNFDGSFLVQFANKKLVISKQVAEHILVKLA